MSILLLSSLLDGNAVVSSDAVRLPSLSRSMDLNNRVSGLVFSDCAADAVLPVVALRFV
ncbi:hypothetical protein ACFQS6_22175 [Xanthomonas populi]